MSGAQTALGTGQDSSKLPRRQPTLLFGRARSALRPLFRRDRPLHSHPASLPRVAAALAACTVGRQKASGRLSDAIYSRRALDDLTSLHRRRAPDEQHSEPVTGGWQSGACFGIHSICCSHSPLVQMTSIVHWMQLHGPLCRPAADGQSTPLTSRAGAACAWLLDTLVGCFAAGP